MKQLFKTIRQRIKAYEYNATQQPKGAELLWESIQETRRKEQAVHKSNRIGKSLLVLASLLIPILFIVNSPEVPTKGKDNKIRGRDFSKTWTLHDNKYKDLIPPFLIAPVTVKSKTDIPAPAYIFDQKEQADRTLAKQDIPIHEPELLSLGQRNKDYDSQDQQDKEYPISLTDTSLNLSERSKVDSNEIQFSSLQEQWENEHDGFDSELINYLPLYSVGEVTSTKKEATLFKERMNKTSTSSLSFVFTSGTGWGNLNFIGGDSDWKELRSTTEQAQISWLSELTIQKQWASGFTLLGGLQYRYQAIRFDYTQMEEVTELRENELLQLVVKAGSGASLAATFGDTLLTGIRKRAVLHSNTIGTLAIPLRAGYLWRYKRYSFGLEGGLQLVLPWQEQGRRLNADGAITIIDKNNRAYQSGIILGQELRLNLGYRIRPKWRLEWAASIQNSSRPGTLLEPKIQLTQYHITVGLRYFINHPNP